MIKEPSIGKLVVNYRRHAGDEQEIHAVLAEAVQREQALAKTNRDDFLATCQAFERQYGMASDDFLSRFESGELGDDADFFDWFAAKQGLDYWDHRHSLLDAVDL